MAEAQEPSSDAIDLAGLKAALARVAAKMEEAKGELNELDGQLGDGDLGVTMTRGMAGVMEQLDSLDEDLGQALKACAGGFTKVSGSTFGTLFAASVMAAAKQCSGKSRVPWGEISGLIGAGHDMVQRYGKAEHGDKTMLDMLAALRDGTEGATSAADTAAAARRAVSETLERFRGETARQGRARMYGEKSVGLDDPGMLALARVVEALSG